MGFDFGYPRVDSGFVESAAIDELAGGVEEAESGGLGGLLEDLNLDRYFPATLLDRRLQEQVKILVSRTKRNPPSQDHF